MNAVLIPLVLHPCLIPYTIQASEGLEREVDSQYVIRVLE